MLTLQETRCIHDSMNIKKLNVLLIFTFYYKYIKHKKIFIIRKFNSFGLRVSLTLQETRSIHDAMNIPKNEIIS